MKEEVECSACQRNFSTTGNLKRHMQNSHVCREWTENVNKQCRGEYPMLFNVIQNNKITSADLLSKLNVKTGDYDCKYCQRQFQRRDALSKHLRTSVVCDKWKSLDLLRKMNDITRDPCLQEQKSDPQQSSEKQGEIVSGVGKADHYENFEAPKYSLLHIIWNVFLTDKEFVKKNDFKNICDENNVQYVLAIVPDEQEYFKTIDFSINHSMMIYDGHRPLLDLERFDSECAIIKNHRSKRHNVMVFCNSGYQRSLPFLCYYLYKHHRNEVPTIERAMDIILPQVDKASYPDVRDKYIETVTDLFTGNSIT